MARSGCRPLRNAWVYARLLSTTAVPSGNHLPLHAADLVEVLEVALGTSVLYLTKSKEIKKNKKNKKNNKNKKKEQQE
jgi:hypothetical protein